MDLISIHLANTVQLACDEICKVAMRSVGCTLGIVTFLPGGSQQHLHAYPPNNNNLKLAKIYVEEAHRLKEIWCDQSKIIKHGFCTCTAGIQHRVSLVVRQKQHCLSTLTLFKDTIYTEQEISFLHQLHPHFSKIIHTFSIITRHEIQIESLSTYIQSLSSGLILLDWDLSPLVINQAARWTLHEELDNENQVQKPPKYFKIPDTLRSKIKEYKQKLTDKSPLVEFTQILPGTSCKLSFLQSKKGCYPGLFLLTLEPKASVGVSPHSVKLSRAERIVYELLARGLSNEQIADRLTKPPQQ